MNIPGIYVEIRGDSTQLRKDILQSKEFVAQQAKEISNKLNNALDVGQVSKGVNNLVNQLGALSRSSHLTGQSLTGLGVNLKEMTKLTGMAAVDFEKLQNRMLKTQIAAGQEKALISIAKSANLTATEIRQLGQQFGLAEPQIKKTISAIEGVSKANQFSVTKMKDMIITVGLYTVAFTALQAVMTGVRNTIRTADEYTLLDSKLKTLTGSAEEATKVYQGLFDISQRTGTSMLTNAQQYTQFGMALKHLNISSGELLSMFETVNQSVVVSGSNIKEATAFIGQFRQGMVSGKFAGDEFKSMMENNAYFGVKLAQALDTDVAGLYKMKTAGQLTTQVLRDAFPKMAAQIEKDFSSITKTMSRAMVELDNSFADVINTANKTTGASSSVAESISNLAKTITENKTTISDVFVGLIKGAEFAIEKIALVTKYIQGLGIVAASEDKSLWDWMTAKPGDIDKWKSEVEDGTAFLKDKLIQIGDTIRSLRGEDKTLIPALLAEKKRIKEEIEAIQSGNSDADNARLTNALAAAEARANTTVDPGGKVNVPAGKETSLARDENAYHNARLERLKASLEAGLAIEQSAISMSQEINEAKYSTGLKSQEEYLTEKNRLVQEELAADLEAKQKMLAAAKDVEANVSDIKDKEGKIKEDATLKAKEDAAKKVIDLTREVQEAQAKMDEADIKGATETELARRQKLETYREIEVQLLQSQGKFVEAARLEAQIDADSIERSRLKLEGAEGVAAAYNLEAVAANKIALVEVATDTRRKQAVLDLAQLRGEHTKSRDIQIELLDLEIKRAELAGELPEQVDLLREQRRELERMQDPLTAMAKGWEDVVKAQKDASEMMYEFGRDTAQKMYDSFSDILFDGLDTGFDNLGDIAEDTWDVIYKSFLRMLANMATAWAMSEIANFFGYTGPSFSVGGGYGGGGINAGISGISSYFASDYGGAAAARDSANLSLGDATPAIMNAAANNVPGTTSGLLSTAGGVIGVAGGAYGMYSGLQNIGQGNYGTGAVQTGLGAYSSYQGAVTLGLVKEGAATAAYEGITSYFSGGAAAQVGADMAASFAANAAADAAGTYAASITAAEFGAVGGTTTTVGTTGAGAMSGGMAAAGPAAIVAMAAMVAGMIIFGDTPELEDRLGRDRTKPGDLAGYGGSGEFGSVSNQSSYQMPDYLKDVDQISADAANNMVIFGRAIEDTSDQATGATEGMEYMMQSYDPLTGMWTDTSAIFNDMLGTMLQLNPATQEAVTSTANYLAQINGVPAAADELVTAFTQTTTGTYELADATSAGTAEMYLMLEEMQRLAPTTDIATTSTALYVAQMYGVPEAAMALEMAFYSMQGGIYGLAGAAEGAAAALAAAIADVGVSAAASASYAYNPISEGGGVVYTPQPLPPELGHASGGTITSGMIPRGDDVLAGYQFGEVVLPVGTSQMLDRKLKDGSLEGKQAVIHNHFYVDSKEISHTIMPAVDKHVTNRQRQGVTGRARI